MSCEEKMRALMERIEGLKKAGMFTEVEEILATALAEAERVPVDFVVEFDMGPDHKFAGRGFRRERPVRRFIGNTRFRFSRVVGLGMPTVKGDKMLAIASERGCDTTLEEGEWIATFFNSPAGRDLYRALQRSGICHIILPNKDGLWRDEGANIRYVPVLDLRNEQCETDLYDLGFVFDWHMGLLAPCEVTKP